MKKPKSFAPAFDFYPERWLAGTAGLTDTEQLRYLRLLCHQWIMDGLPDHRATIARLAGGKVSEIVMSKFPVSKDGSRRNPMLEKIRADQAKRIESYRDRASQAALKRWKEAQDSIL